VSEQAVAGTEIDDAPAAEPSSDPARHFPRFEQFLAWQTSGAAHRPPDPVKQRIVSKSAEVVCGEPRLRRRIERLGSVGA
jgi:hypothetical protein